MIFYKKNINLAQSLAHLESIFRLKVNESSVGSHQPGSLFPHTINKSLFIRLLFFVIGYKSINEKISMQKSLRLS